MLLANTKHLPPYVVPTLPDLLLMDEPMEGPRGVGLVPWDRGPEDWLLAEVHWSKTDFFVNTHTSRYYLVYTCGKVDQPSQKKHYYELFRGWVLFEEFWHRKEHKWQPTNYMWMVHSQCKAWKPDNWKHNSALRLLLIEWQMKRDRGRWGHFSMIYSIHKDFTVNEMREIARQVWPG